MLTQNKIYFCRSSQMELKMSLRLTSDETFPSGENFNAKYVGQL